MLWKYIHLEEAETLAKENNIVKQKFKESVAITQEKKGNLLNKNEERKIISGICSLIITQIKVILFFYSLRINKLVFNYLITKN